MKIKMKNELILVEDIEKRLKAKREPPVFPLTPTHRKELRILKRTNIGNLMDRMRTLKELKREEYLTKYKKEIQKEFDIKKSICDSLNADWKERIDKINKLLDERKILEKKTDLKFLNINNDWSNIAKLEKVQESDRHISFEVDRAIRQISDDEFDKKYGVKFTDIQKKIDDVNTKYEEAINFGDLEIVKELYYIMKSADRFFDKVSNLEI